MKRIFVKMAAIAVIAAAGVAGWVMYAKHGKIIPYMEQLEKERVGNGIDLQPGDQKKAMYVGSAKCVACHQDQYERWHRSMHAKMIQDVGKDPRAVIGDFLTLPADANFKRGDVVYTIGGKFKQRYMTKSPDGKDFVIGNYQWNTQLRQWQPYSTAKDWYHDAFDDNNSKIGTSKTCDGCHFTGFMSREKRVEPAIACESCHGPGSLHATAPKDHPVYNAMSADPRRTTEVCLQCHMRNRDKRMESLPMGALGGDVRDYPKGYEPGRPLIVYKTPAPFHDGNASDEFYANGVGKKNRTQGNEFVRSAMYKHGITCVNCHDPHTLDGTTTTPTGDATCMKCHSLGSVIGPHQDSIEAHTHHKAGSAGSSCIECHMPKTGKHLPNSPLTVRTHVFGFITPSDTKKYNVPNACTNCHKDQSVDWADRSLKGWGIVQWNK